jgi:hypothetical protein
MTPFETRLPAFVATGNSLLWAAMSLSEGARGAWT